MASGFFNRLRGFLEVVTSFPAGISNDGVFGMTNAGVNYIRNRKGVISAEEAGIVYDGTNMFTRLNAIFALAKVKEIHFDCADSTNITVTGTVNCNGKKLVFKNGNKFIGTHTLDNGTLDCDLKSQCFTPTTTLTNFQSVRTEFTFENYGAIGAASDETTIMQKTVDTVIRNARFPKTIQVFSNKTYACQHLILHNWDGADYQQFAIAIVGEKSSFGGNSGFLASIKLLNTQGPGIGVQRAAGFSFIGLQIYGANQVPDFVNWQEWYLRDYATFASAGGCFDKQLGTFSCINIDPFRLTNTNMGTSSFPDFNGTVTALNPGGINWHRGTTSPAHAGSTGGYMHDLSLSGTAVGIMISGNGETQQGENMVMDRIYGNNLKTLVATGSRENKNCSLSNVYTIWDIYQVLDGLSYGYQTGSLPNCTNINIAGITVQFGIGSTQHVALFQNIYSELLLRVGDIYAGAGRVKFLGCNLVFNLDALTTYGIVPATHYVGNSIEFDTCTIRYYDDQFNKRAVFQGGKISFQNCTFDLPPIGASGTSYLGYQNLMALSIRNCFYGDQENLFGFSTLKGFVTGSQVKSIGHGRMTIEDNLYGSKRTYDFGNFEVVGSLFLAHSFTLNTTTHTGTFICTGYPIISKSLQLGDYLMEYTTAAGAGRVLGRIQSINNGTGVVSLIEVPLGMPNGTTASAGQPFSILRYNIITERYTGVYTYNTNTVTSVFGLPVVGQLDKVSGLPIISFVGGTITLGDVVVCTGAGIERYNPGGPDEQVVYSHVFNPIDLANVGNDPVQYFPGDIWISSPSYNIGNILEIRKWRCTQSGYTNPTAIGQTKQSLWEEFFDSPLKQRTSGSADYSFVIPLKRPVNGYDFLATAGMTINIGTTPGGSEIENALVLTANVTESVQARKFFDVDTTIYITGVTGGTLTTKVF